MLKAALFDLDGVLIDSVLVAKVAFTLSYAQRVGKGEPPLEQFLNHMGESFENILAKMGLPAEMNETFRNYSSQLIGFIRLQPGIIEVLKELKTNGIAIAIVTGKDRKRVLEILERFKIAEFFDVVVAGDDVQNSKPHPEPINRAIRQLKLSPENAVMIGDAPNDLVSAKRAGVWASAVGWGVFPVETLASEKPHYVITRPSEILEFPWIRENCELSPTQLYAACPPS
jgi:3-amino-5-hydroxybenzoic acid synthesis related protein